jgi:hypothetical protein
MGGLSRREIGVLSDALTCHCSNSFFFGMDFGMACLFRWTLCLAGGMWRDKIVTPRAGAFHAAQIYHVHLSTSSFSCLCDVAPLTPPILAIFATLP